MVNNESSQNNPRINTLAEKLKSKLKNFTVVDRQGQLIGRVNDLILDDQRQLNLVVYRLSTDQGYTFLLQSKLIQNIDPLNQSVLVGMDKVEIENLPEYATTGTLDTELPEILNMPLTSIAIDEDITDSEDDAVEENLDIDYSSVPIVATLESQAIQDDDDIKLNVDAPQLLEEEIIRLLGERLVVEHKKRKIGEVIVRKEIEIRMVQVPVRREKLIVEQVSPEHKQLAEIILDQEDSGIELTEAATTDTASKITTNLDEPIVRGEFNSPKIASLLLNAIALERQHGCKRIRVEIVVEDPERQKIYQEWINRSSGS